MHFRVSHLVFAITMIAMGAIGILTGTFAPIWAGVPKTLPDCNLLAGLCTFVSLACGIGLLLKRTAAWAALALLVYLLVWTAAFKFPFIVRSPLVEVSYQSTGENLVLVAAVWLLYARLATSPNFLAGDAGQRIARVLYGLALIAFGLSHFVYLDLTAPLVPVWLPAPEFWAYLTGTIDLATGTALVLGFVARAAAVLIAVQIALITFLVWGPVVLRGSLTAGEFQETVVSWALTAAAWLIAASFDGRPWLIRRPAGEAAAAVSNAA